MKKLIGAVLCTLFPVILFAGASADFSHLKGRVSEFTLKNGLKFILLEDHSVPVASFFTYVNVGASDESETIHGISHVMEHLAFKGTSEVGTTDYKGEKKVLDRMENVHQQILAERDKLFPDQKRVETLQKELQDLEAQAAKFVVPNELDTVLKRNGAVGLNAGTSQDYTMYFYSLPSNKLELWASLEAARFVDPVFREFYKEIEVIKEERRMRTENSPIGKLLEEVESVSFKDHPYKSSVVGPMSNLNHISVADVRAYHRRNYTARNMVIGVTGDVTKEQLQRVAEKYFSGIREGMRNNPVVATETPQTGTKEVTLFEESQPWLIMGYHCPASSHRDYLKFELLNYILTNGRSSRLYKKLVIDEKSALAVASFVGYPGSKYPGLYLILTIPGGGKTNADMEKVIFEEIEKLVKEPVSAEELLSAKNRLKQEKINTLSNNSGLLMELLSSEVLQGSWSKTFDTLEELEKITSEDIQTLVKGYLVKGNLTIGRIEKKEEVTK